MTVYPLLPRIDQRRAWSSAQAQRARARMLKPWQRYLAQCHGVWALQLCDAQQPLPLASLRMAQVWRFGESFRASNSYWPIQLGSLDLVIWRVQAADFERLPSLIAQMTLALGPAARVLIWLEAPLLNNWCQTGMPLCTGHDWVLRRADWGDARVITWLPSRWSANWSASWQMWLPRGAQWSVQLWQRETACPSSPAVKRLSKLRVEKGLSWQPQSTLDHSK